MEGVISAQPAGRRHEDRTDERLLSGGGPWQVRRLEVLPITGGVQRVAPRRGAREAGSGEPRPFQILAESGNQETGERDSELSSWTWIGAGGVRFCSRTLLRGQLRRKRDRQAEHECRRAMHHFISRLIQPLVTLLAPFTIQLNPG